MLNKLQFNSKNAVGCLNSFKLVLELENVNFIGNFITDSIRT